MDSCNSNPQCAGFSAKRDLNATCDLLLGTPLDGGTPSTTIDYFKKVATYFPEAGIKYTQGTNVIPTPSATAANCASLCTSTPACLGYAIYGTVCELKNALTDYNSLNGFTSYRKVWMESYLGDGKIFANYAPDFDRNAVVRYENVNDPTYNKQVAFGLDGTGRFNFYFKGLSMGMELYTQATTLKAGEIAPSTTQMFGYMGLLTNGKIYGVSDGKWYVYGPEISTTTAPCQFRIFKSAPNTFTVTVTNGVNSWILYTKQMPTYIPHIKNVYNLDGTSNFNPLPAASYINDVRIYDVDGGYNPAYGDLTSSNPDITVVDVYGQSNTKMDLLRHAAEMITSWKNPDIGSIRNPKINVQVVKTPGFSFNYFYENNLVLALDYIINDNTFTGTKIVSIPASDNTPFSDKLKCAFEFAYKKGITIFMAAGNSGGPVRDSIPHIFRVGAVCSDPVNNPYAIDGCAISSGGKNVSIWAPGFAYVPWAAGTSFATSQVAAVAASNAQKPGFPQKNPAAMFAQLRKDAKTFTSTYGTRVIAPDPSYFVQFKSTSATVTGPEITAFEAPATPSVCANIGKGNMVNVAELNTIPDDTTWMAKLVNSFSFTTTFSNTTKPFP